MCGLTSIKSCTDSGSKVELNPTNGICVSGCVSYIVDNLSKSVWFSDGKHAQWCLSTKSGDQDLCKEQRKRRKCQTIQHRSRMNIVLFMFVCVRVSMDIQRLFVSPHNIIIPNRKIIICTTTFKGKRKEEDQRAHRIGKRKQIWKG